MNGQPYAPTFLTPEKDCSLPPEHQAGWASQSVWSFVRDKSLFPVCNKTAISRSFILQPGHYTDWANQDPYRTTQWNLLSSLLCVEITHFNGWHRISTKGCTYDQSTFDPTNALRETPFMTHINSYTFRHRGAILRESLQQRCCNLHYQVL
jgi:hypothetical protein